MMKRTSLSGCLQTIGLVVLAVLVGVFGFIPLLPMLFVGPASIAEWGPSNFALVGLTLSIYFVCGAVIGYLKPGTWIIAGLLAWLCIVGSLSNLALAASTPEVRKAIPLALLLLVLPLTFALGGAYVGRTCRRRPHHKNRDGSRTGSPNLTRGG
jgi:hypothetical protein